MPNDWTNANDTAGWGVDDDHGDSPYAPPKGDVGEEFDSEQVTPDLSDLPVVYSPEGVAIGTFLGGPVAATVLMAINFTHLDDRQTRTRTIFLGGVATIATFAGAWVLPSGVVNAIPLSSTLAAYAIAKSQRDTFQKPYAVDLPEASRWKAAGIGLVGLLVTVFVFLGAGCMMGIFEG